MRDGNTCTAACPGQKQGVVCKRRHNHAHAARRSSRRCFLGSCLAAATRRISAAAARSAQWEAAERSAIAIWVSACVRVRRGSVEEGAAAAWEGAGR